MNSRRRAWSRAISEQVAGVLGGVLSPAGRGGRLPVFTYHQVLDQRDRLRPGEPDRNDFVDDIETIGRVFNVLPLAEAARRLANGTLPRRAACITFDDGYANNHATAAPLLSAAGLPATFFITCGAVDEGVMWNDLVIEAVARGGSELVLDERTVVGDRGRNGASEAQRVGAILDKLKYLPLEERLAAARDIYARTVGSPAPRLMMTRAMVADLARRGFEIGGHTMRHPILTGLPDAEARAEIEQCRDWIKEVTGTRPPTFAYPNGRPGTDFVDTHADMVAEAGYEAAVSTSWDLARRGTHPYKIPRVGPWWRQGRSLASGSLRIYVKSYLA